MLNKVQRGRMQTRIRAIMSAYDKLPGDTDEGEGDILREDSPDSRISQTMTDLSFVERSDEEIDSKC